MELKTLSRQDPEFDSYLRGTFSKTKRAIPVQSLNVDTAAEKITFQVLDKSEIQLPKPLVLWSQVFRVRNFLSVLFPLYLIIIKNSFDEVPWDDQLAIFSILGALSLSLGAFLLNDYLDHMKGVDRIHPGSGSQAIQKGWVTAEQTRRWSLFYLIAGALLGTPAVFVFPGLLVLLSVPALVALLSWMFPKIGLKYRRGAELVVFLLFGPLLTIGFHIAITGFWDLETLFIGILTGWHFVFLVHAKNFANLVVNSQAGFRNTIARLGFERGKKFLAKWWAGFIALMCVYQWIYHSREWFLVFLILTMAFSYQFFSRLKALQSPAGSELSDVVRFARLAALLTLLLWTLQSLWYWLVIELGSPS